MRWVEWSGCADRRRLLLPKAQLDSAQRSSNQKNLGLPTILDLLISSSDQFPAAKDGP